MVLPVSARRLSTSASVQVGWGGMVRVREVRFAARRREGWRGEWGREITVIAPNWYSLE